MRTIVLNNSRRLGQRLGQLLLIFMLTTVAIGVALYMSNQPITLGRFAVVGQSSLLERSQGSFKFIAVTKAPSQAELMMGKYDGYIIDDSSQDRQIVAPKKPELGQQLSDFLSAKPENQPLVNKPNDKVLNRVIGFLMLFLLIGGSTFLVFVGEDRERHQLERILVSPLSLIKYLTSQLLFGFCGLYLPTIGLFSLLQLGLKQDMGASLFSYSWLLGLICLLGVSFATMMMSVMPTSDSAQMITSAIVILTTIISGSFGALGKQHRWFEQATGVLPQKSLLSLVDQVALGEVQGLNGYLLHIIFSCILFLVVAFVCLNRQLKS